MASDPQDESARKVPPFLPLSEKTMMARMTNQGVAQATEALRGVLFSKPTPYPWTLKSVMIEVERDGRRYEVIFVGERWARAAPLEKQKASKALVESMRSEYEKLDEKGKQTADSMFVGMFGLTFADLIKETEVNDEEQ